MTFLLGGYTINNFKTKGTLHYSEYSRIFVEFIEGLEIAEDTLKI